MVIYYDVFSHWYHDKEMHLKSRPVSYFRHTETGIVTWKTGKWFETVQFERKICAHLSNQLQIVKSVHFVSNYSDLIVHSH